MHAALKRRILNYTVGLGDVRMGLGDVRMGLSLVNTDHVSSILASMTLLTKLICLIWKALD